MLNLDLVKASLKEVVEGLKQGDFTSEQLLRAYFERVGKDNVEGLGLRAVVEAAPDNLVFSAAKKLDEERAAGQLRSRLHGVPIVIKEGISTHPSMGMKTTGGLIALEDSEVTGSAPLVDALLSAGVIILGKANMAALNNFYGSISNGWSPRGGQTVSAYVSAEFHPGGSSTGSAVALSAGFCAASIGCETLGSIMGPACRAGLYAFKPTAGLIPNERIIPISTRVDTAGPMGKSAWDVAAMLDVMVGGRHEAFLDSTFNDTVSNIAPPRIGVPRREIFSALTTGAGPDIYTPELKQQAEDVFESVIQKLHTLALMDPADVPNLEYMWQALDDGKTYPNGGQVAKPARRLFLTEFYEGLNAHLESRQGGAIRSLADLVDWNTKNPDLAYPPDSKAPKDEVLRESLELGGRDSKFEQAMQQVQSHIADIEKVFEESKLDALLFPSGLGTSACRGPWVAATKGYPLACVPVRILDNGQPYSVVLMGRHGQDATLLRCMAQVEQLVGIHPTPDRLQ